MKLKSYFIRHLNRTADRLTTARMVDGQLSPEEGQIPIDKAIAALGYIGIGGADYEPTKAELRQAEASLLNQFNATTGSFF
ncbi:MAG: hypothetical protein ABI220_01720 [Candidatus Saccharimonadales bacterium]